MEWLIGAAGGLVYGLLGWFKNYKYEDGEFDFWKMAPTIVLAGVIGLVGGWLGLEESILVGMSVPVFFTHIIQKAFKGLKE